MRFGTAAWHLHLAAVYSSVAQSMILNMKTLCHRAISIFIDIIGKRLAMKMLLGHVCC